MSTYLPFVRPTIDEQTIEEIVQVLRSGWLATGPYVTRFESALSAYLGNRTVRAMTSGTAALELALQAIGVGPGDEVIVPAMSFAASANVVLRVAAKPVFVDVELATRNMDVEKIEAAITPKTRAIMPVHFAGLPVNLDRVYAIARERGVRVIEDAAHAIGTRWHGKLIGSFGDIACFSFHPNKNMTTIEGGAIAMNESSEALQHIELERFHGIERDANGNVDVVEPGGKYNLSDVAARLGLAQLERLEDFNARRRALSSIYFDELGIDPPGVLPDRGDAGHCWNMFTLLLPFDRLGFDRNQFQKMMAKRGIAVGIHYPSIPSLSLYRRLGYRDEDYPNAARIGRETVTLPLFPAMTDSDVKRVCDVIRTVIAHRE